MFTAIVIAKSPIMASVSNGTAHNEESSLLEDPFTRPFTPDVQRHRYSGIDAPFPSIYSTGSPGQAKKALEAHLAETDRRLQEASRLGQILVKQRKEIGERIKDIREQQDADEVAPELRQKLVSLEKEVHEVSRESARTFLSRNRVASHEVADASMLSADGQHSPTKAHPPSSRKLRNQPSGRVNDIKLATDISQSLLNQVRELQAAYAEKEEAMRIQSEDGMRMQSELAALQKRVRTLDENEQRFKDENWSLETQVHELSAAQKDLHDREQKLQQSLNLSKTQHATVLREFEEMKQAHGKLSDDRDVSHKQHEVELSGLRRDVSLVEHEKDGLQKRIDELVSQNKELAKAISYRAISGEHNIPADESILEDEDDQDGRTTPEHSPPGSPSKATPRHGALESETLKSSLHHAHRMIQNLKNNIHREKTEKLELKRMLQDTRDEMENRRSVNSITDAKKRRQAEKEMFKKPARPGALGSVRSSREDIIMNDDEWEEHDGETAPVRKLVFGDATAGHQDDDHTTDAYATATEHSDAFETADERNMTATDTDAFQTTAETLDGNSEDELTETEGSVHNVRPRVVSTAARPSPANRNSFQSTASSGDEYDFSSIQTPIQQPKYKGKAGRIGRTSSSRAASGAYFSQADLPSDNASREGTPMTLNSNSSTPAAAGQSLFAELGDFDDNSTEAATPMSERSTSLLASPDFARDSVRSKKLQLLSSPDFREHERNAPSSTELLGQLNEHKATQTALQTEITQLREEQAALKATETRLLEQIAHHDEQQSSARALVAEHETRLHSSKELETTLQAQIVDLEQKERVGQVAEERLQTRIAELEKLHETDSAVQLQLQSKITELEQSRQSAKTAEEHLQAKIMELEELHQSSKEAKQHLQTRVVELEQLHQSSKDTGAQLQSRVVELEQLHQSSKDTGIQLQSKVTELEQMRSADEIVKTQQQDQITELTERHRAIEAASAASLVMITQLEEQHKAGKETGARLMSQITEHQAQLKTAKIQEEDLQAKIAALEEQQKTALENEAQLRAKIADFQVQQHAATTEITQHKARINELDEQQKGAKVQEAQLQAKITEIEDKLQHSKTTEAQLIATVAGLEATLRTTRAAQESSRGALEEVSGEMAQERSQHQAIVNAMQDEVTKRELAAETNAQQLADLQTTHDGVLRQAADDTARHAAELEALRASHGQTVSDLQGVHADLTRQANEDKTRHVAELDALRASHEQTVSGLQGRHTELERQANEDKIKHIAELEILNASTAKKIADLEGMHAEHVRQGDEANARHIAQLGDLHAATKKDMADMGIAHQTALAEADSLHTTQLESLKQAHTIEIGELRNRLEKQHLAELELLQATHSGKLADLQLAHADAMRQVELANESRLAGLRDTHLAEMEALRADVAANVAQIDQLHRANIDFERTVKDDHAKQIVELHQTHVDTINGLKEQHAVQIQGLKQSHAAVLRQIEENQAAKDAEMQAMLHPVFSHSPLTELVIDPMDAEKRDFTKSNILNMDIEPEVASPPPAPALVLAGIVSPSTPAAKTNVARMAERFGAPAVPLASLVKQSLRDEPSASTPETGTPVIPGRSSRTVDDMLDRSIDSPTPSSRPATAIVPIFEDPATPPKTALNYRDPNLLNNSEAIENHSVMVQAKADDQANMAERDERLPFQPVESNGARPRSRKSRPSSPKKQSAAPMTSEGTQTMLSAIEINQILRAKAVAEQLQMVGLDNRGVSSVSASPRRARSSSKDAATRRPGSSSSVRTQRSVIHSPPLPSDANQTIANATQKAPVGPVPVIAGAATPGKMGPPTMPASAYKRQPSASRPRTPLGNVSIFPSPSKSQQTIVRAPPQVNTSNSVSRSNLTSPVLTRRSSVSSFATELDHRFNIGRDAVDQHGFDPSTTDPRMIQAITQTMIGEWLWKYVRKTGRQDLSSTRHRRFFWVHPYTRTLYWSEHDPSRASKAQMKAKSVPIESVHMVNDENPMPPGLHRKSIVITTPGRSIMFTATTAQRHETWFNALSYLLLRTGIERTDEVDITSEDVAEFNPTLRSSSRQTGRSRHSISSYIGRSPAKIPGSPSRSVIDASTRSRSGQQPGVGRLSSLGTAFRSSSRQAGSIHSENVDGRSHVNDSAEDLRQVIEAQEIQSDRLENVRACCDGKFTRRRRSHGHVLINCPQASTTLVRSITRQDMALAW